MKDGNTTPRTVVEGEYVRVSIEHRERAAGFLGSCHQVEVITRIEFSDEELSIIENRQLQDHVVIERAPDSRTAGKFTPDELSPRAGRRLSRAAFQPAVEGTNRPLDGLVPRPLSRPAIQSAPERRARTGS